MKKSILTLMTVLIGTSAAFAQGEHAGTAREQQACSRDASRFCRMQLGDDGAVRACLEQNRKKLTAACRNVFRSHGD